MDKKKTPMPLIAGILMLVSEGFKFLALLGVLLFLIVPASFLRLGGLLVLLLSLPLLAVTALAVIGGIFALLRKRWGWALAGSIVCILPFSLLGIAATILVALSRDEFDS
jgi:hypothetical protein